MTLTTSVSVGDIVIALGLVASVVFHYTVNTLTIKKMAQEISDLRRGRGLILGPTSDWPPRVKRCFGYYENGKDVG